MIDHADLPARPGNGLRLDDFDPVTRAAVANTIVERLERSFFRRRRICGRAVLSSLRRRRRPSDRSGMRHLIKQIIACRCTMKRDELQLSLGPVYALLMSLLRRTFCKSAMTYRVRRQRSMPTTISRVANRYDVLYLGWWS
jgi:hypothetical protein